MDAESTLRAALHADPAALPPRLALADWLEEQGLTDLAEFHRLVAARKKWPQSLEYANGDWWHWYCNPRGLSYLSPAMYVTEEQMKAMGGYSFIGKLWCKRFGGRHGLWRALDALERVWLQPSTDARPA